jgi:hypothetical protein
MYFVANLFSINKAKNRQQSAFSEYVKYTWFLDRFLILGADEQVLFSQHLQQ